jgi:hypothetical protein
MAAKLRAGFLSMMKGGFVPEGTDKKNGGNSKLIAVPPKPQKGDLLVEAAEEEDDDDVAKSTDMDNVILDAVRYKQQPVRADVSNDGIAASSSPSSSSGPLGLAAAASTGSASSASTGSASSGPLGLAVGASTSCASSSAGPSHIPSSLAGHPDDRRSSRRKVQPVACRGDRSTPWGIWAIAEVVRNGTLIGWGATCGQHRDQDEGNKIQCKRQLMLSGLSSDDCRRMLKAWLLAGHRLPGDHAKGRTAHMDIKPRGINPLPSEAELDEAADRIARARGD